MISSRYFWEGKKVVVMGLGLLGRGVGDVAYIASQGAAEVVVTDMKTREQLAESVAALEPVLKKYTNIRFALGGHRTEDFVDADMVIKAAGVPQQSMYLDMAREHGIPIYMSTALAAKWCMEQGVRVVGVTGTRGKSTVTHCIYSVLSKMSGAGTTFLGGNVRGVSTLALLDEISPGDTLVLELDSWQLQGFGDLTLSPNISVFTNLMPDHLNYYASMDDYMQDKAHIFLWQKEGDTLVCGESVRDNINALYPPVSPLVPTPQPRTLKMLGEHNQENAALAAEALRACGLSRDDIERGLQEVESVEGRLQFVKTSTNGDSPHFSHIAIYNDNNATTPEATIRALESFVGKKVTLICGGADKGLPLDELVEKITTHTAHVVLLPGTGTDKLVQLLAHTKTVPAYTVVTTMHEAVAKAVAYDAEILLFSPGFASFGLFKNEYDRNDQFVAELSHL